MRTISQQINDESTALAGNRLDCAVVSACTEPAIEGYEPEKELLLILSKRPGRHPVQFLPREEQICWMSSDGTVEFLSIDRSSPNFDEVLSEINSRGLLVAELADGSELSVSMKDLQSGAQTADFWLLDSQAKKNDAIFSEV